MESPKKNPQPVRAPYTKEFNIEAVRLLQLGQKSATELARNSASDVTNSTNGPRNRPVRTVMKPSLSMAHAVDHRLISSQR